MRCFNSANEFQVPLQVAGCNGELNIVHSGLKHLAIRTKHN